MNAGRIEHSGRMPAAAKPQEETMKTPNRKLPGVAMGALALLFLAMAVSGHATILGVTGTSPTPTFTFTAMQGYISTPDGNTIYSWGYANTGATTMQLPGPTIIVNQGDTVTINLKNSITIPGPPSAPGPNVSMLFPGQQSPAATGGIAGLLTQEAPADGATVVTYTFVAANPGTSAYYSGTHMALEVEMGLYGAIIVRPTGFDPAVPANRRAYNTPASQYDQEYLYLLSDLDPDLHPLVEQNRLADYDNTSFFANNWLVTGRCFPDTMADPNVGYIPTQPYNTAPLTHPGEKVLLRFIGAGHDLHPLHHHGNNTWQIAKDGKLLESVPGVSGPDLAVSDFTETVAPGETIDSIWTWTGAHLGWDEYGHTLGVVDAANPFQPNEITAQSTLAAGIGASDTSLSVASATGHLFLPPPRSRRAIIWGTGIANPDLDPNREVVTIARSVANPDTFSIVARGQEGTTARAWPSGSIIADTDHGVVLPVQLPSIQNLEFGNYASGSPYLGSSGPLPPLQGGFNPYDGYYYMFHSHNEKEIVNNNVFPGGMLTMMGVLPPGAPIP
jgi:FtsP/CotA-like multicopper oxidase with cupredoxin domain